PGFVMALAGTFERSGQQGPADLHTALTGNLCRCTGYLPILEAGRAIDPPTVPPPAQRLPPPAMVAGLPAPSPRAVRIQPTCPQADGGAVQKTFFAPQSLEEAIDFKARNPEAVLVSGGTELGVLRNKKGMDPRTLLTLTHVAGLGEITQDNGTVVI